jgi:ABC-2 type transport system permease protein
VSAEPAAAPFGRVIKGPSAVGTDARRFRHLTWALATTDFKLRFFGSVLGYVWQLLRPLMLFGVLLVLFTKVVDLGEGVVLYAPALLLGMVLYQLLSDSTGQAVRSLMDRENLVRKVDFPRLAVPLSTVLVALFNYGLNFIVVMTILLASGGDITWSWLQIIPLSVLLVGLCIGLSMMLSILFVRYRDVEPIWDVSLTVLFYASAIFFPVQIITGPDADLIRQLLMMNPFAAILQQARHAMIDPSHPSAADAAGGLEYLLIPLAIGLLICVIGGQLFRKRAPRVAEEL